MTDRQFAKKILTRCITVGVFTGTVLALLLATMER